MIRLEKIGYAYKGASALVDVSFEINKGEKVVLMGVNGSGKSTLLKLLDGLIFPNHGNYYYKNEVVTKKKTSEKAYNAYFRSQVVMLFQKPDVMLFNPTVYEELGFGPRQLEAENIDEKIHHWAERLSIAHLLNKQPFNLSCGEKKKVAIASLLIIDPEVIILDEPFSYLDPQSAEWMVDFLTQLDKTLIISIHNFKIASLISKRLLVLSGTHRLIYDGLPDVFSSSGEKLKSAGMFTTLNLQ